MNTASHLRVIVHAVRLEARHIVSLELQPRDGTPLPAFAPGAHVDLHLAHADGLLDHCRGPLRVVDGDRDDVPGEAGLEVLAGVVGDVEFQCWTPGSSSCDVPWLTSVFAPTRSVSSLRKASRVFCSS